MKSALRALCALPLAVAIFATPAAAAIIVATTTGTISSGIDGRGLFGNAGADLTGQSFTFVATFDSTFGEIVNFPGGQSLSGGTSGAPGGSPGSGYVTINSYTFNIYALDLSIFEANSGGTSEVYLTETVDGFSERAINTVWSQFTRSPYPQPGSIYTPFTIDPCGSGDRCLSAFTFDAYDVFTHDFISASQATVEVASIQITVDGVSAAPVSSIPEPGTWALMLTGFALGGSALRRQRARTAAVGLRISN